MARTGSHLDAPIWRRRAGRHELTALARTSVSLHYDRADADGRNMQRCSVSSARARIAAGFLWLGLGGFGGARISFLLTDSPNTSFGTFAAGFLVGSLLVVPRFFRL